MEFKDIANWTVPTISLIIGYFISKKRSSVEIEKLKSEIRNNNSNSKLIDKESELEEVNVSKRIVEFYENQILKLLDRVNELELKIKSVEELQERIHELEELVDKLQDNQCEMNDCPARKKYEESKSKSKLK